MTTYSQYREAAEHLLGLSGISNPAPELLIAVEDADADSNSGAIGHGFVMAASQSCLSTDPSAICNLIFQRILRPGMPEDAMLSVYTAKRALDDSDSSNAGHMQKMGAFFLAATRAWAEHMLPYASVG